FDRHQQHQFVATPAEAFEHEHARGLRHRFHNQHTGHHRESGKMAAEKWLVAGNVLDPNNALRFHFDYAIDEQERVAMRQERTNLVGIQNRHGSCIIAWYAADAETSGRSCPRIGGLSPAPRLTLFGSISARQMPARRRMEEVRFEQPQCGRMASADASAGTSGTASWCGGVDCSSRPRIRLRKSLVPAAGLRAGTRHLDSGPQL